MPIVRRCSRQASFSQSLWSERGGGRPASRRQGAPAQGAAERRRTKSMAGAEIGGPRPGLDKHRTRIERCQKWNRGFSAANRRHRKNLNRKTRIRGNSPKCREERISAGWTAWQASATCADPHRGSKSVSVGAIGASCKTLLGQGKGASHFLRGRFQRYHRKDPAQTPRGARDPARTTDVAIHSTPGRSGTFTR